jgi:serine/threonine protein kinase
MASAETPAHDAVPQAQSASLVGQILDGRYRILRKLGAGGMGEVYAAEHVHIEKKLAIKLLHQEIVSSPEAVTRFFQAARLASLIGHRNIAEIVDFGRVTDGRFYLCMELLAGAPLRELTTPSMGADRLLDILLQAGQGLAAAHARGIVHRDLKPENIFVAIGPTGEDVPKLLDFGITVSGSDGQNDLTRTGTILGTPFYLSPEQAVGNPVDARTDIYALGAIMYECFSGTPPFQGDSFMSVLSQHITVEPEPVAERAARAGRQLPPGLAETITQCMQKDPAQRFQTMDDLVTALIQIHRGVVGPGTSAYMEAFPVTPSGSRALPGSAGIVIAAPGDGRGLAGGLAPGRTDPSSGPSSPASDSPAASALALDENVQFTVYRPRTIAPVRWHSLLAFAHLAERRPGEIDTPDPIDEVRRQAEGVLGERAAAYQSTTQDSGAAIPAEGELVFVVEIPGVEVNPPRRSFSWTEPVHREEFRIRAGAQLVGTTVRGRLTVFLGCIVIAELPLAVRVDAAPTTTAVEHTQVRTYRRIFASYSHRDRAIVHQFERYARALGDEYLRDAVHLRSGEVWSYQLLRLIEQADAFQLFWSHNSMHSIYVRREYEYALSLNRPSFVRPTYWEDPMPKGEGLPPEALRRLHFQKLGGTFEDPQLMGAESSTKPSMPFGGMMDSPAMPPPRMPPPEIPLLGMSPPRMPPPIMVSPPREPTGTFGPPGMPRGEPPAMPIGGPPAMPMGGPPAMPMAGPPAMPMAGPPAMPMGPAGLPTRPMAPGAPPAGPGGYSPASPAQKTVVADVAPATMGGQLMPPGQMQPGFPTGLQTPPGGAPASRPNQPTKLSGASEGVVPIARSGQAVPPPASVRLHSRWPGARRASLLALTVLALLALCVLLRWIF